MKRTTGILTAIVNEEIERFVRRNTLPVLTEGGMAPDGPENPEDRYAKGHFAKEMNIAVVVNIGLFDGDNMDELLSNAKNGRRVSDGNYINTFEPDKENVIRRNHLENVSLKAFASKMNKLDPEMNIRYNPMEAYDYKCPVIVEVVTSRFSRLSPDDPEEKEKIKRTIQRLYEFYPNAIKIGSVTRVYDSVAITYDHYKIGEIDANGYKTTVEYDVSGFYLEGYDYLGTVSPMTNADENDLDALTANVKLYEPYDKDQQLIDYLTKTSARIKCDGCGRTASRGVYYVFKKQDTGEIVKYGRNCATKIFGIDIVTKLERLLKGLQILGQSVSAGVQSSNFAKDKVISVISVMMMDNLLSSFGKMDTDSIMRRARYLREAEFNMTYMRYCEAEYKFNQENIKKIEQTYDLLMLHGDEIFRSIDDDNEFKAKLKAYGINLVSSDEKAFKRMPEKYLPWIIREFCVLYKRKVMNNKIASTQPGVATQQLPYFGGVKTFNVKVVKSEAREGKNGPYNVVFSVTPDNYGIMWYAFDDALEAREGEQLTIRGTYSRYTQRGSNFATFDNVSIAQRQQNDQAQPTADIELGTRFRDVRMKVVKNFGKAAILRTPDNIDVRVYITNINTGTPKFPGIDFNEGSDLIVTGTLQRNERGDLFINRCKFQNA
jgi:hypothetical protein